MMNNISFSGINISNANVLNHKLSIYRLTEKDKPYLKHLQNTIDIKTLLPRQNRDENRIYGMILNSTMEEAICANGKDVLLLSCNDKPCGLVVSTQKKHSQFIDYICTWPIRPDEKAPFGAQTLFTQIFKDFLKTSAETIELYAVRYGKTISKYIRLGFKSCGGDDYTEIMRINKKDMASRYNDLCEKIKLTPSANSSDVDLFKVLTD